MWGWGSLEVIKVKWGIGWGSKVSITVVLRMRTVRDNEKYQGCEHITKRSSESIMRKQLSSSQGEPQEKPLTVPPWP